MTILGNMMSSPCYFPSMPSPWCPTSLANSFSLCLLKWNTWNTILQHYMWIIRQMCSSSINLELTLEHDHHLIVIIILSTTTITYMIIASFVCFSVWTCCMLLIQWLSGLWGVSKPFLPPKMGRSKKNSSLTAKPTTQPLAWHSDPGTPLLNTISFKAKHLHPSLKGLFRAGHQATVQWWPAKELLTEPTVPKRVHTFYYDHISQQW